MSADDFDAVAFTDAVSDLMSGLAGWLLVGLGVLGLLGGVGGGVQRPSIAAAVLSVVSVLFIALGVLVNPRFRRRLARRRSVTRFGRARSVDNRVLRSDEGGSGHCVACRTDVDHGLVRRYREELLLGGVPVYTLSAEFNRYCPECATAEFSISGCASERDGQRADEKSATQSAMSERR